MKQCFCCEKTIHPVRDMPDNLDGGGTVEMRFGWGSSLDMCEFILSGRDVFYAAIICDKCVEKKRRLIALTERITKTETKKLNEKSQ